MHLVRPTVTTPLTLYGAAGSGSVAVEAALRRLALRAVAGRFDQVAPKMSEVVRQVDAEPRLAALWAKRFSLDDAAE